MELILIRMYYAGGTNGTIYFHPFLIPLCYTIELPWHDNEPGKSCIPEGRYALKKRISQKFGEHLLLEEVSEREYILIHPANNALRELRGCIAPVGKLTGEGRGSQSRVAFDKLKRIVYQTLKSKPVYLTIKSNHYDNKGKNAGANTAIF